jgi:hypothetical protein
MIAPLHGDINGVICLSPGVWRACVPVCYPHASGQRALLAGDVCTGDPETNVIIRV